MSSYGGLHSAVTEPAYSAHTPTMNGGIGLNSSRSVHLRGYPPDREQRNNGIYNARGPVAKKHQPREPETFEQFNKKNPGKYYELGGLGPVNVGTEQWKQGKNRRTQAQEYARSVREKNMNSNPPARPKNFSEPGEQRYAY